MFKRFHRKSEKEKKASFEIKEIELPSEIQPETSETKAAENAEETAENVQMKKILDCTESNAEISDEQKAEVERNEKLRRLQEQISQAEIRKQLLLKQLQKEVRIREAEKKKREEKNRRLREETAKTQEKKTQSMPSLEYTENPQSEIEENAVAATEKEPKLSDTSVLDRILAEVDKEKEENLSRKEAKPDMPADEENLENDLETINSDVRAFAELIEKARNSRNRIESDNSENENVVNEYDAMKTDDIEVELQNYGELSEENLYTGNTEKKETQEIPASGKNDTAAVQEEKTVEKEQISNVQSRAVSQEKKENPSIPENISEVRESSIAKEKKATEENNGTVTIPVQEKVSEGQKKYADEKEEPIAEASEKQSDKQETEEEKPEKGLMEESGTLPKKAETEKKENRKALKAAKGKKEKKKRSFSGKKMFRKKYALGIFLVELVIIVVLAGVIVRTSQINLLWKWSGEKAEKTAENCLKSFSNPVWNRGVEIVTVGKSRTADKWKEDLMKKAADLKYIAQEGSGNAEKTETYKLVRDAYRWNGPVLSSGNGSVTGPNGRETFYNLNMSTCVSVMHSKGFSGSYRVRSDGCKMFGNYVMVAANLKKHPKGSIVRSSRGLAIVVDTGGFASSNPNQLDLATNW